MVDTIGLLLAVLVTAAHVDDAKAVAEVFTRLEDQPMSRVQRMFGDNKYYNYALYQWVDEHERWKLVIVRRPELDAAQLLHLADGAAVQLVDRFPLRQT